MIQQILNWLRNSKSVTEFTKKVATWFFSWMWINEGSNITIDKEPGGIIINAYSSTGGGDDGEQEIYTIKITSYDSENIYKCNIYDIYEGEELETDQTVYIYQFDETVIVPSGTWLMATKHKEDTNDPPDPPDSDPVWEDRYEAEYSNRIYSVKITSHDSGNSYKCKVYDRENGTELLEDQTLKIYNIDASLIIPADTWLLAFWNSNGEYEAEYEINISGLDNLAITDITNLDKYLIWDASENKYKKTGSDYRLKVSDDDTTPNYLEEKLTANNSNCGIKLEVLNPAGDEEIEVSAKVRRSIEISNDYIQLKNDELNPGNDEYYGTNSGGVKGFYPIPSGLATNKVLVSDDDTTAGYLDAKISAYNGIAKSITNPSGDEDYQISADVQNSIELGGTTPDKKIQLKNDELNPGNDKYYGTNSGGVKGFHAIPSGLATNKVLVSDDDTTPNYLEEKLTVNNSNCGIKLEVLNPAGNEEIEVSAKVRKSIEISNDYIQLKNDELNPGNDKYYGTNSGGVKGFHAIPGGGGGGYSGPFALSIASGTVSITAGHATLAYKVNTIASDTITADVGDYIWYKFDDLDSYTLEKGSTWPTQNEDYVYFILGKVSSTTVMDQYHYGDIQDNARAM